MNIEKHKLIYIENTDCEYLKSISVVINSAINHPISGLLLGLRPANERRRYFVIMSLIGWAQTKKRTYRYARWPSTGLSTMHNLTFPNGTEPNRVLIISNVKFKNISDGQLHLHVPSCSPIDIGIHAGYAHHWLEWNLLHDEGWFVRSLRPTIKRWYCYYINGTIKHTTMMMISPIYENKLVIKPITMMIKVHN